MAVTGDALGPGPLLPVSALDKPGPAPDAVDMAGVLPGAAPAAADGKMMTFAVPLVGGVKLLPTVVLVATGRDATTTLACLLELPTPVVIGGTTGPKLADLFLPSLFLPSANAGQGAIAAATAITDAARRKEPRPGLRAQPASLALR